MKKLRVLVLMHHYLVPPEDVTGRDLATVEWKTEYDVLKTLREELEHDVHVLGVKDDLAGIRQANDEFKPHIAFNLMEAFHEVGTFDQNVVSYLELLRLPYSGCNPRGMLLSRDKALSKQLLQHHRVQVPDFVTVLRGRKPRLPKRLTFPLIVKSLTQEASIGISQASVVEDEGKLRERVEFIHESVGTDALVEEYVDGRELYCGVIGNQRVQVLPVWEMTFEKMPEDQHRIATERVKWSPKYQKKMGIDTGEATELPEGTAAHIQTDLQDSPAQRVRAHRSATGPAGESARPRSQPQSANRARRGLRPVGGQGRHFVPGAPSTNLDHRAEMGTGTGRIGTRVRGFEAADGI
jgi:D-alanine-D-alanine ligase